MNDESGAGRLLRRWGRFVAYRPVPVLIFWVVFVIGGFATALGAVGTPSLFTRLHSGEILVPGENRDGRDLLTKGGSTGFSTYVLTIEGADLADPAVAAAAGSAVKEIVAIEHVDSAVNPFVIPQGPASPQAAPMLGECGLTSGAFATVVTFDRSITKEQEEQAHQKVDAAFDALVADSGATDSQRGGVRDLVDAIIGQVRKDATRGEGIALPISFIIMVVVFGGFLAAGMPILGAIASIAGALASLLAFSYLLELDAAVVNVVTVLGLGLCIDYGLLVVSRFREEMKAALADAEHLPPGVWPGTYASLVVQATERTLDRAGRTVVFSALIVAISLAGLFVFDVDFIRAVAAAGVSVVAVALAVGISLVPAMCVLGSRRVLRKGTEAGGDHGIFSRLAGFVHARPWPIIVLSLGLLVVLALPSLNLRLMSSGAELLPKGAPERVFFEKQAELFPHLGGPEVTIVTTEPVRVLEDYAATARELPGVRSVDAPRELEKGVSVLGLRTGDGGQGDASRELVEHLRVDRPPFEAKVVGMASGLWDFHRALVQRGPLALALVALATFVLLFLMTGSVVVPIKALAMNIVSLGACLGVVVWVFQEGNLSNLLGFTSNGGIEATMPVLILAFGFGLSMDYEVFLLSRIVELHRAGMDTDTAVQLGLQRSGRIITSAALLMVVVFAGFAAGELLIMKQMGLGLVVAIVVDASIVRMLLVPATMTVLGSANWWAPKPLRALHARFGITE